MFFRRYYWEKLFSLIYERIFRPVNVESVLDKCVRVYHSPLAASKHGGVKLRILFLAHKDDYGNATRGLSIEENYFFHSLYEMGYELIRFDFAEIMREYGRKRMNEMLMETVYRYAPDLLFSILFKKEVEPDTIRKISSQGRTVTMNWFCDDLWRFEEFSQYYAPCFHWVITTAASALSKYREAGVRNVIFSQWACNHHLCYKMDLPKIYDISFVGLPHGNRREVIARMRKEGLDVRTWGYGWKEGRITQSQMVRVFNQSRINLNLSNLSTKEGQQIKERNFEIPGCGGFLLTGYAENLSDYYDVGKEIACFDDVDDLIRKAKYFLAHEKERAAIAEAGYARTIAEHTYDARFRQIFAKVGLIPDAGW